LCVGSDASSFFQARSLSICSPAETGTYSFPTLWEGINGPGYIVVIANHYAGCVAGRREANIFSYTSSMIKNMHPNIIFISSKLVIYPTP
jgi:hypothetical protein